MSAKMHAIAGYVRVVGYLNRKGWYQRPKALPTNAQRQAHRISMITLNGHEIWSVEPKSGTPRLTLIYLHGGAYVAPISRRHWPLFAQLVDNADCRIIAPLYGLAPDFTYREAHELLDTLVHELIDEGTHPTSIVLAGDSAGGGLALALAHKLRDQEIHVGGMVLISPWLDLAMTDSATRAAQPRDPWLRIDSLRACAELWAGGTDLTDPLVSTINASQEDLPTTLVLCGDRDIFLPHNKAFADEMRAEGGQVAMIEEPGALHVYPLLPTPEGHRGRQAIFDFLNRL